MSRGLLDDYQVATAMRNEAVPALERLAENDPLRKHSLRRFDRDDPPPCTSSTEDDYEEEDVPPADEITRILNEPLTDKEFKLVAHRLDWQLDPGPRYNLELEFELERLDRSARDCTENTRKYFLQYGPPKTTGPATPGPTSWPAATSSAAGRSSACGIPPGASPAGRTTRCPRTTRGPENGRGSMTTPWPRLGRVGGPKGSPLRRRGARDMLSSAL